MVGTTAIIGAGWLGAEVANACPRPVLATTRSGRRPVGLADDVAILPLDLLGDAPDLGPLSRAQTWVVAIAPGRDQDRRAVYLDGPARLFAALAGSEVRRVVWIGSTSALPDVDGPLDETESSWPAEPRGRIQREAEALVETACGAAGVPWMVLRMGGLYGPVRELGRLFGQGDRLGDGDRVTNLVHRDDAVAATLAAIASPHVGVVHVVDDDHRTRRAMIDAVRAAAGHSAAIWPDAAGRPHGKRVDNRRLREWLGVVLRHPHHGPLATPEGRA
jgi:nucleoside-diphosphate-sugar epimerase